MADPDTIKKDNAPEEGDDTKTRKTVRLKPSMTPSEIDLTPLSKPPLADPFDDRDTDTGNLEVMEDTQTRRTVKLKPIATQSAEQPKVPMLQKPLDDGSNTQTRKTIVLKPMAVSNSSVKLDAPTGTAPKESDDTKTRKTVRLHPSAVTPSKVQVIPPPTPVIPPPAQAKAAPAQVTPPPAQVTPPPAQVTPPPAQAKAAPAQVTPPPAKAAPAADDSDDAGALESSDTIKIARPVRPGGMIPPKVPIQGATPNAAPNATPGAASKATMVLPGLGGASPTTPPPSVTHSLPVAKPLPSGTIRPEPTKPPVSKAVPVIPTLSGLKRSKPEEPEIKPTGSANSTLPGGDIKVAESKKAQEAKTEATVAPKTKEKVKGENAPSRLYLILAAVSLVLIILTLTFTAVQYLNIWEEQKIILPLLPQPK
ncbi:MAG: hypothetical protein LBM70_02515 [Victivallales bacterium]|jgi:hypothetical protein|nr:hypothetical protein [Victivallales bacterium]